LHFEQGQTIVVMLFFFGLHAAHGSTIFHLAIGFEFGGTMALHVAGCSHALLYP